MTPMMIDTLNSFRKTQYELAKILQHVSSGKKLNSAVDDPAGLAISIRLQNQSAGLKTSSQNISNGLSLLQTADGGAGSISGALSRMRELALQADNGTLNDQDRQSLQAEFDALRKEISHTSDMTDFNGNKLLDGSASSVTIHSGDASGDVTSVNLANLTTSNLGIDSLDLTSDAQGAISAIDSAIDKVNNARSSFGASSNQLQASYDSLEDSRIQTEKSRSKMEDSDLATELSELVKKQILSQGMVKSLQIENQNKSTLLELLS